MVKLSVVHNASLHSFYELFSLPSCQNPCRFLCVSTTSLQTTMQEWVTAWLSLGLLLLRFRGLAATGFADSQTKTRIVYRIKPTPVIVGNEFFLSAKFPNDLIEMCRQPDLLANLGD